jgi:hypothetical protein
VIDAESEEKRRLKMRLLPNYNKALVHFRKADFALAKELFQVEALVCLLKLAVVSRHLPGRPDEQALR